MDAPVVPFEDSSSLAEFGGEVEQGAEAIAAFYGVVDLESRLEAVVARFDAEPYAPMGTAGHGLVFTGEDAVHALHSALYLADFVPLLDVFLSNLEDYGTAQAFDLGEVGFPTGLAPTLFDLYAAFIPMVYTDNADGMVTAITCSGPAASPRRPRLNRCVPSTGSTGSRGSTSPRSRRSATGSASGPTHGGHTGCDDEGADPDPARQPGPRRPTGVECRTGPEAGAAIPAPEVRVRRTRTPGHGSRGNACPVHRSPVTDRWLANERGLSQPSRTRHGVRGWLRPAPDSGHQSQSPGASFAHSLDRRSGFRSVV